MQALGSEEIEFAVPVERCFDWETFALAELEGGDVEAAEAPREAGRGARRRAGPAAARGPRRQDPGRGPAAQGRGESGAGAGADRGRGRDRRRRDAAGRLLASAARDGRSPPPASASEAIAELREAERELDACGSLRERDAVRRDLRKLGARREARGPAAGETGVDSLTKREREIAALVTDRLTNKEIAAELFLSEKTIESHLRNIFFKLGASSRVEVARAVEREQRR